MLRTIGIWPAMRLIATAGHVDHGKSTLVRALTGTDPDRWAAEKERGLTIDLGFAAAELPAGPVAFIDVPGHERYLSNMLAGVGAMDAVLLVVSAAEGWKAQSEEHLAIIEILGLTRGVVALTNIDRVDGARCDEVTAMVESRLVGGPLEGAELVAVSAPVGAGIENLRAALDRLVRGTPAALDRGRARLWADRAFSLRGAGTVVTGTLTGGLMRVGQALVTAPGGRRSRVRAIQVHDTPRDVVAPGHRVALNLPDLAVSEVSRGVAVVEPARWHLATSFDATLTVLPSVYRPVTRRGAYLLHTGAGSWAVRLEMLRGRAITPGSTGQVRLHLKSALPLGPSDRFVLRDSGPNVTVGGGTILDVDPILPVRIARPDLRWERVVDEHGWIDAHHLACITGVERRPTAGAWVVSDQAVAQARSDLYRRLENADASGVRRATLDDRIQALIDADLVPDVVVDAGYIRLVGAADRLLSHPWLDLLRANLFSPPPPEAVPRSEVEALISHGLVIRTEGICFHAHVVDGALSAIYALTEHSQRGFTVSDFRKKVCTSRRYALPILCELDARGLTYRKGSLRCVSNR